MITRRHFTRNVLLAIGGAPVLGGLAACSDDGPPIPAGPADLAGTYVPGLDATIPEGASLRRVAHSKQVVAGTDHIWHSMPDGGACFAVPDGGWIYVSNCENDRGDGGVGALRFNAAGDIVDAYPILADTSRNCAGGKTPWGTWLSCEENGDEGQVYECDPTGQTVARVRPAMGSFNHEAAAVDPRNNRVYLTEDLGDGCLYRFTPDAGNDLSAGTLEVAQVHGMRLGWARVPDPSAKRDPTRYQVPGAARFRGGEGIVFGMRGTAGWVYFTTKGDNRVWGLNVDTDRLTVVYDASLVDKPILTGVDNIEMSPNGELIVAEDGGDMQLVSLGADYQPVPLVTLHNQMRSELAGPAFSPDGRRLYFSAQKSPTGDGDGGQTYELTLPA